MYMWLLQAAMNKPEYTYKANMVVIETIPNFNSRIYPVSNKHIRVGLSEMKDLIIEVAKWKIQKRLTK